MIQNLIFVNPITNQTNTININYPDVDYIYWRSVIDCKTDKDVIKVLEDKLNNLDCTKEYDCGRPMMTTYFNYNSVISDYFYYLYKLNNQLLYNEYINKFIDRHIENIVFEYEHPYLDKSAKKVTKRKKKPANKFIRYVTFDIFTNEKIYVYENLYTKEQIKSDNPNLLEELNAPKKKEHKKSISAKKVGVPISAMTFNFKKK